MVRKISFGLVILTLSACGANSLTNPFGGSGGGYGTSAPHSGSHDDSSYDDHSRNYGRSYQGRNSDRDAHIDAERRHLEDEEREEQGRQRGHSY